MMQFETKAKGTNYTQWVLFALSVILLLLSSVITEAQTQRQQLGRIQGVVVDAETGEPLMGVNVMLKGTMMGAAADLDGNYIILRVPSGKYDLIVSMIGYAKTEITGVTVSAGEVTRIDVSLKQSVIETEGVIVTAKAVRNTEAALLKNRQKANAVSDAISAEAISRVGSGNAAEAMKQVTGASVVDGKYVYVRGLGDRYTSTQLNGVEIPSTDPYKRAGSIDLIPSNLIDNIVTVKSFTADKPGDFSGGTVDIQTRDFLDNLSISFSTSSSYNTQATFNDGFLTCEGGDRDWLGMDDGTRDIPPELQSEGAEIPNDVIAARKDADLASKLDKYTKLFNSQMIPSTRIAPLNQSYAFSIGNQVSVFKRPLGFLASLSYSRTYSFYDNGRYMRWRLVGHDTTKTALDNEFDLEDTKSTDEVLWGGLLTATYKLAPEHKIGFNGVYNQNAESIARVLEGSYPYDIDPDWIFISSALLYNERTLKSIQLDGEHQLDKLLGARLQWRTSYSNSTQDEPDLRYFTNYISDKGVYGIKSNLVPERYYRFMDEDRGEAAVDVSIPFKQWRGRSSTLKFGGLYAVKNREFSERLFKYQPVNGIGKIFRDVEGDVGSLLTNGNLGIIGTTVAPDGTHYYDFGITISEVDQKSNNYTSEQTISAFYSMLDVPLFDRLRFIGGARYETTDMLVESENPEKPKGEISTYDVLPSVNFVYNLKDNMNLRLACARTLARPTFREISPFASFDFKGGTTFLGNPDLKRTLIDNLDLRWEWFSRPGEIYAVSAFWKDFHDPIEVTIIDENYNIQWKNVDEAKVIGLEFEVRKGMDIISSRLSNFMIGGNLSLIRSSVGIDSVELNQERATMPDASSTREFQGQSPYLLNVNLTYDNFDLGIVTSLYYNIFGKRLAAVSLGGTPDVYEQPAETLSFSFSKRFGQHLTLKFSGKNLLDTRLKQVHEYKGKEYIYSEFGRGRSFSVGLKCDLG